MTLETERATLAWLRDRASDLQASSTAWGNRMATWLIVGHAAALLAMFSAADSPLGRLAAANAGWFLFGLATAFVGAATSYAGSVWGIRLLSALSSDLATVIANEDYLRELEREFPEYERKDDDPLVVGQREAEERVKIMPKRLRPLWLVSGVAVGLYALSGAVFVAGAYEVGNSISDAQSSTAATSEAPAKPS